MSQGEGSGFEVGESIGRFRLVAPLDEGSMGRVWGVEGPSGPAAMKLLSIDVAGVRERFEREARLLMKLRHPNVVRAIDYGHAMDGTPFMAMELLDGESLQASVDRRGKISVEEAVSIVVECTKGLHAAHELGIVHRDVKPANIFLCNDDTVKVLDFGIAFWSENDGRMPAARLTAPGVVMGTPSYMAPEQAAGDRDEDVRTDVWGLSAVLYDCIEGRVPFDAQGNYLAEMTRILTDPPDPLAPHVPAHVVSAIMRGLSKQRDHRHPSMPQLRRALLLQDGPPSIARPNARPVDIEVMGALSEEVRLVTAILFEGLANDAHNELMEAVQRFGGVGSAMRGQHAVAIFGANVWIGDEAERAVRLGLEVRDIVRRIGVGTGKAMRRIDGKGVVTGPAVAAATQALRVNDTAAKTLRRPPMGGEKQTTEPSSSNPGSVFVCAETLRRVHDAFELVGGRVVGTRMGAQTLRPRQLGGAEVPLVGRAKELTDLIEIIANVNLHNRAAAVIVTGPPGIGKSRLRFELLRWMSEDDLPVTRFEARGEMTHDRVALGIIREMLRNHAGIREGIDQARGQAKIEALVESAKLDTETSRGTADFIGELLGIPFPTSAHMDAARSDPMMLNDRIRLAVGALFEGIAMHGFVLILLEDAQWADAASLSLIDSLLEQLGNLPLAIIATARPAFFVRHEALDAATRIPLGELTAEATATIVQQILGRAEPTVVQRSTGNPYLAEELSLAVMNGADPEALPLTVEGAVQARLDKLAPDEKDLLKRASVLGQRFWLGALKALGEPLAARLLAGLSQRELVVKGTDSRLEGCEEWRFRQPIVYEVCRGLLTPSQRQALHKAAASWLSRRADAQPEAVAAHFEEANEASRALLWWMRAMHAAHERGDSRSVTRFGREVLALADTASVPIDEIFNIHLLRSEAWFWLADRVAMDEELNAASQLAEQHGDTLSAAAAAQLQRWRALHAQRSGRLERALYAAEEAARLADQAATIDLRVQTRASLSELHATSGDLDKAAEVAAEALEIAKQGDGPMVRATAARALAHIEAQRGNPSMALVYFKMARDICMSVGGLREAALNSIGVGSTVAALGDYEQAATILSKTLTTAQSLGLSNVTGWVNHHLGLVLHRLGKVDEALRLEEEAISVARELDDARLSTAALQYRSIMLRHRGDSVEALQSLDLAIERDAHHNTRAFEQQGHTLRAQTLVALGRFDEALTEVEQASTTDARGGLGANMVDLLLARHDALLALDQKQAAAAALQRAKRWLDEMLANITSDKFRRTFTTQVPSHARLALLLDITDDPPYGG